MTEHRTEADAVAAITRESVTPDQLAPGMIYAVPDGEGSVHVIDTDNYAERPRCKAGHVTVIAPDDLIGYLDKHGLPQTELWGSRSRGTIKAVIDANGEAGGDTDPLDPGAPGWGRHTITLQLTQTDDWADFVERDRAWKTQHDLAEFIEDHLACFVEPSGADMLELAQSFQATKKVSFEGGQRLASGETTISYREEIEARAGRKGTLTIPDRLTLALQPYEGGKVYRVGARLRYRLHDGDLALSIALDRPADVLRDAFAAVAGLITEATGRAIWLTP